MATHDEPDDGGGGGEIVRMADGCGLRVQLLVHETHTTHEDDGTAGVFASTLHQPLVLAVHDIPGISSRAEAAAAYGFLTSHGARVLVVDLRGTGDSDRLGPYTHEQWLEDLDELRTWAHASRMVLAGNGHGAMLALAYAAAWPDRVRGLILGSATAHFAHIGSLHMLKNAMLLRADTPRDPELMWRWCAGRIEDDEDLAEARRATASLYWRDGDDDDDNNDNNADSKDDTRHRDDLAPAFAEPLWETFNAAMGEGLAKFDVREQLSEMKVPAMVYVGRHDWITPVELTQALAEALPDGHLVVYEESGHFAAVEEASSFREDVRQWLEDSDIFHPD